MQPRRPPSLPPTYRIFPGLSSFPHFERDPPRPWPDDMENSEPELPANVDIVQKQVPTQLWSPLQSVLGQQ
jgi:hypothetical protein